MIGEVRVANWKRLERFEHTFAPGITFILGANGHGKTSLLEAIKFGLFGVKDGKETREAIRFNASSSSVQVQLVGNDSIVVGRTIDSRGRTTETLDTAEIATPDDVLQSFFGADPALLRSLVFLSEGDIYAPGAGNVGLEQQLEALLSMQGLSVLVGEIRRARGPLSREQRTQRSELQLSRDEISQMTQDEARLRAQLEHLRNEESELQNRYLVAADQVRGREQWDRLQADLASWRHQLSDLARTARLSVEDDSLDDTLVKLERRRESLEEALRRLTEQRGELAGRVAAIRSFLDRLEEEGVQVCPLCRQSLDGDHRVIAIGQHSSELETVAAQEQEVEARLFETRRKVERERELAEAARRLLASRPSAPPIGSPPPSDADAQLERAQTALEELRNRRAWAEQQLLDIRERLATAEASRRLEEQVTAAFRAGALLEVAESGIQEFLGDVRQSVMAPLAEQLSQQWKAYRPDAEWSLALDDSGAICLTRDGTQRSYAMLSGGEKTVAIVLLRVAMLTALTTSDVMVLDEPLEHLDPRARRIMMSSLHHAVRKGLLKQVIVSTYEESLVRRLLTHPDVDAVWLD